MKKKILVFYDYFFPAFRAGGPVQSLANMIRQLYEHYEFYVLCRPHEMYEKKMLTGIRANEWNEWENKAKVFYWTYGWKHRAALKNEIRKLKPDILFVNGLYSFWFNIYPLLVFRKIKIVLSVRGMLHPGALSQKSLKKKLYLGLLNVSGIPKEVVFHATDEQEKALAEKIFGKKTIVKTAGNFPNVLQKQEPVYKEPGRLKVISIALISPMKNHLLVVKSLEKCSGLIQWDIFGPVKDKEYWETCKTAIRELPEHIEVNYHGELDPGKVEAQLAYHHILVQPSKSENFGHSIFEALSAGRPVITSSGTPWQQLQEAKAGYTIGSEDMEKQLAESIRFFADMNNETYKEWSEAARKYALQKVNMEALRGQYKELFEGGDGR